MSCLLEEGTLKKATWMAALAPSILTLLLLILLLCSLLYGGILAKGLSTSDESPTVPEVASAPQQTQLFLLLQPFPPSEDTDMTAGTFSALVASSSLSLRTEPPLSAYPMTIPPGAEFHENIN
ncbi:hypothetical protein E2320_022484, partial [Naja naja]